MKVKSKSRANRWMIGLIAFAVLVSFGAVYATDICRTFPGNGEGADEFFSNADEDFYFDLKAPASGVLHATVEAPGQEIIAERTVSNGQRQYEVIDFEEIGYGMRAMFSEVTNHVSGTGYVQLSTVGAKKSNCIPSGNNQ